MNIIICGTGAMSCLFGARLAAVANVTLLGTWAEGITALRERGILVERNGSIPNITRVNAGHLEATVAPADLVLVLVKAWQTQSVACRLPSLLNPGGVVLTLQNGLGNLELLGSHAFLGVTTQGATLLGPGRVRPGGDGPTHIAAPPWVSEILRQAGFEAYGCAAGEVDGLLWGKLTANCAINPLTALLRVPNGVLLDLPDALKLLDAAARECAAVARSRGIVIPFADPAEFARDVAGRTAGNISSMLQDILRDAPTEIDAINGALMQEGNRLRVPVPVNETLYRLVKAISTRGDKGRAGTALPSDIDN